MAALSMHDMATFPDLYEWLTILVNEPLLLCLWVINSPIRRGVVRLQHAIDLELERG
jgi:hypothetical protein